MHGLSWVGIGGGRRDACCVVMSVKVWVMYCGSVQHIVYMSKEQFLIVAL